jgi:hypothetical protein
MSDNSEDLLAQHVTRFFKEMGKGYLFLSLHFSQHSNPGDLAVVYL